MKIFRLLLTVGFFLSFRLEAQQSWPGKDWPQATPASQSVNADSLKAFAADIAGGRYGFVDGLIVTRNGKLIFQEHYKHDYGKIYGDSAKKKSGLNPHDPGGPYNYYNAWWHPFYHQTDLHSLQSVTKTITSVIIGVAVTRGEFPPLSTPVLHFFDTTRIKNSDERKRRMTIRHLLTMTAGFDWDEGRPYSDPRNDGTLMEASCDWIQYVIDKPMAFEPGEVFRYNSGASELLSHIFSKATGRDIEEYAWQYLFSPLSIRNFYWKRTPTGLADTEGGLYLSAQDLAKIYYLFLKQGNWDGKQLVSAAWVKESVSPSIEVRPGVSYGYKWWLYAYGPHSKFAWAGSGFGGQWPVIIPEYDIVAVFTGWNIAGGRSLRVTEAINRLLGAVKDRK